MFVVALLAAASVWGSQAVGKETKWAMWGSTGGSKSGGGSWWAGMQNGATSFFASTRNVFAGRSASPTVAPKATTGRSLGNSRSTTPWFTGNKPRSKAEGGSSRSMDGFIGAGRPSWK
jgi:hypothetical protein